MVVSAPSGCGKGTILNEVLKDDKFWYSVSATTRKPRPGEVNGVNYFFLSKEEFEKRIAKGEMLEWAKYVDNYYGTPAKEIEIARNKGKNVVLEIEIQGAFQIKKKCPDANLIFIIPPSFKELEKRLRGRGTETEDVIAGRTAQAKKELPHAADYDYIIVNDDLETACNDFRAVVRGIECKQENNKDILNELEKEIN